MKQLITILLILTTGIVNAQKVTVYTVASVDSLLAKTTKDFTAQILVLQNQLNQQQIVLNTLSANQPRPMYMDPVYFIITRSTLTDSITLRNPILVR